MFGLATGTELRLAAYGVLLAAISGWLVYEHHHLIAEGEATVKAQDATARAAQKAEDEKTSSGVVNDLKSRLQELAVREPPARPAPVMRLCVPARYVRTSPTTPGAQPAVAGGTGEIPSGMSTGTLGIDIGPDVQASERAAEVLAIYADETRDWAIKQAQK